MRLTLFQQFFAVIVTVALVSELAMAAALGVALQNGFTGYLQARDAEDLRRFADALSADLAASGGELAARSAPEAVTALLRRAGLTPPPPGGRSRPDGPPFPPPGLRGPPPGAEAPAPPRGPPPPRPPGLDADAAGARGPAPAGGPPEGFADRLMIFAADGSEVAGPPPPLGAGRGLTIAAESVFARGRKLGEVRLLPRARAPHGVDSRFLGAQTRAALALSVLILVASAAPAGLIARRAAARLTAIQAATRAVADGDFAVRLPEAGGVELAETSRNINQMAAALDRLQSARRRWLAEISHELRTPLAALRGELDAMLDGVRRPSRAGLVSLGEEVGRLEALVEDLHLLAVADLKGPICRVAPCDAAEICRDAVARFRAEAGARGLDLALAPEAPPALAVRWDAARIAQTLSNLLTNALRYTDAPGEVRVALAPYGERVEITVEDTAPCPPDDELPKLFEPLYRVDAHRSRAAGGSGLGLALCAAIAGAHGGEIMAARSALGGLKVALWLPREAP